MTRITKTNRFAVKDIAEFDKLMAITCGDYLQWNHHENNEVSFSCDGVLYGIMEEDDDGFPEESVAEFISKLQKVIKPEAVVVIMESGFSPLDGIIAKATIVSSEAIEATTFQNLLMREIREKHYKEVKL